MKVRRFLESSREADATLVIEKGYGKGEETHHELPLFDALSMLAECHAADVRARAYIYVHPVDRATQLAVVLEMNLIDCKIRYSDEWKADREKYRADKIAEIENEIATDQSAPDKPLIHMRRKSHGRRVGPTRRILKTRRSTSPGRRKN